MDLWFTMFRKALDFQPKVSVYLAALSRRVLPNPQDYRMLQATRAAISTCPNAATMHIQAYRSTLSPSLMMHPGLLPDYLGVSGETAGSLNGSAYLLHIECC